eukprot:8295142-Alexandrium_andersonii.AAC.1
MRDSASVHRSGANHMPAHRRTPPTNERSSLTERSTGLDALSALQGARETDSLNIDWPGPLDKQSKHVLFGSSWLPVK